ncbi:MAG: hypothetical protein U5N26_11605 [Candidatus Marinimicrobia bacterium]|nr:hypothetical protein [Candidatus Neomarinimicrobiota bacterium]
MKKYSYLLLIVVSFLISSCFDNQRQEMPDINVIDISAETEWKYWVAGKEDGMFIKADNDVLEGVLFHAGEADKYITVTFDENELPDKVVIDDYVFILDNFDGYYVDVAVVYPDGDVEIIREVRSSIYWDSYLAFGKPAPSQDLINWAGRAVGSIPCILSLASMGATAGGTWPLAAWVCGNYILQLANDIATDELDIHNGITDFVDAWGLVETHITCVATSGVACATGWTSTALDYYSEDENYVEESEEVQVAEGALESGSGDVQITLTWDTTDDIDLWVTDPYDEIIYWNDKNAESGGYLDFDDMDGYGPENVYWPEDGAPSGTYKVEVDHYSGDYNTNFTVLIQAFGYVKTYYGTVGPDETVTVATFNSNSPLPKKGRNIVNHNTNNEIK